MLIKAQGYCVVRHSLTRPARLRCLRFGKDKLTSPMNIFNWLLIGHLVGDWLLQNDWMATGKKKGLLTWAGTVHYTIYTTAILFTLWLSGFGDKNSTFYLLLSLFIFASHWLIDTTDVVDRWIHFFHQSDIVMVRVMVDQILHIIALVIVTGLVLKEWK